MEEERSTASLASPRNFAPCLKSHEDIIIARCSMARNDHDHSQGRLALRIIAELAAKRTASLKTGRKLEEPEK